MLSFLLDKYVGVELLGYMAGEYCTFKEASQLLRKLDISLYILTSNIWGLPFFLILSNTC